MIDLTAIFSASLICLAGAMSPGPSFVAVSHRAVTGRRSEALAFAFGIAVINALWAIITVVGLGVLLAKIPPLFYVFKIAGALYLIWYGILLIRKSNRPIVDSLNTEIKSNLYLAFRSGVVTNLANPKSMVFYASVFSAALPKDANNLTLIGMVLMVGAVAGCWYGAVALLLSTRGVAQTYKKIKRHLDKACGAALILFGMRQAV